MNRIAPQRPAAYTEEALVTAILKGEFGPGTALPAERELAAQLGVTRPTLREALQRLERDGWVTIHQGKSTLVNDYWREGGLNVLTALVRYQRPLPANFVPNLLAVRLSMAPDYTAAAVAAEPAEIVAALRRGLALEDSPGAFAAFDWELHRTLTRCCGNPVYGLILNGFSGFYEQMAARYFARPQARQASRAYYGALLRATESRDAEAAAAVTRQMMQESIALWRDAAAETSGGA